MQHFPPFVSKFRPFTSEENLKPLYPFTPTPSFRFSPNRTHFRTSFGAPLQPQCRFPFITHVCFSFFFTFYYPLIPMHTPFLQTLSLIHVHPVAAQNARPVQTYSQVLGWQTQRRPRRKPGNGARTLPLSGRETIMLEALYVSQ